MAKRGSYKRFKIKSMKKLGFMLLAAFIVYLLALTIFDEDGLIDLYRMHLESKRLENKISSLKKENGILMRKIESLKSDAHTIESLARQELGLVQKGDIVIEFVE